MTPGSSDLRWPRSALGAAVAAGAVAMAVAVALGGGHAGPPGPLSRSHERAGATCRSCHSAGAGVPVASAACTRCHGEHAPTRAGHRALEARGALACPSCHGAHGALPPVEVPAGRVAQVPLSACGRCHDLGREADPVRACVAAGGWVGRSACLDEHQRAGAGLAVRGACSAEHGPDRYVAWEQARALAAPSPASAAGPGAAAPWLWAGAGLAAGGLVLAAASLSPRRRRPASAGVPVAPAAHVRLPRIDAARCLGCQACVDACPFDVLAVERHLAVVARPDACCGLGACQQACPNGSLQVVDLHAPVAGRLRLDEHLESLDARGVFVAGDLGGVPLIRNAIAQGARVASRIASTLPRTARGGGGDEGDRVDVVVVGAGPAGLSAALRAREAGLSCAVLEQSELAASIRAFPRGKIVHDPPLQLPLEGPLWLRESTKEELVAQWTRIVRAHRLRVLEGHRVTGLTRRGEGLLVEALSDAGPVVLRCARVVLAMGRRGTPRPLSAEVAPRASGRVLHALSDARAFAGQRVLVVGLGDSALEAVVALAGQPGTTVVVSYRGATYRRGSARNLQAVQRLVEAGRVRVVFGSDVRKVDLGSAVLSTAAGDETVPVDHVLALLGGEPSRALLDACGVRSVDG